MSYQTERDDFIAAMAREGVATYKCRTLLGAAGKLHRLAEAMCNGDWPCDNGERPTKECTECGLGYAPEAMRRGVCPECRTQTRIKAFVTGLGAGFEAIVNGDPRGAVLKIKVPSGNTDDWGKEGICVPTRER